MHTPVSGSFDIVARVALMVSIVHARLLNRVLNERAYRAITCVGETRKSRRNNFRHTGTYTLASVGECVAIVAQCALATTGRLRLFFFVLFFVFFKGGGDEREVQKKSKRAVETSAQRLHRDDKGYKH